MEISKTDFDLTLEEFLGDQSPVRAQFVDGDDVYAIRMQRQSGQLSHMIDCMPSLNDKNAWQVRRSQPQTTTIWRLLLMIASAPAVADPHAFFS